MCIKISGRHFASDINPTQSALAREPRPDAYARDHYTEHCYSISAKISQMGGQGILVAANDPPATPARQERIDWGRPVRRTLESAPPTFSCVRPVNRTKIPTTSTKIFYPAQLSGSGSVSLNANETQLDGGAHDLAQVRRARDPADAHCSVPLVCLFLIILRNTHP